MSRDPWEQRLRAARRRHPGPGDFIRRSPARLLRRLRPDGEVLDRLQRFLVVVLIGLALNYAYYETVSLRYLFIGGIQDWFEAFQTMLDGGIGVGRRYNAVYVLMNGLYYFYLIKLGIGVLESVLRSSRPFRDALSVAGLFTLAFLVEARWAELTGALRSLWSTLWSALGLS